MKYRCKCGAVTLWSTVKQDLKCPHCKTELREVTMKQKPEWECQSCGRLINHDPIGTAAICVNCGGTSPLQEYTTEQELIEALKTKFKTMREEGTQSQEWKLDADVADVFSILKAHKMVFEASVSPRKSLDLTDPEQNREYIMEIEKAFKKAAKSTLRFGGDTPPTDLKDCLLTDEELMQIGAIEVTGGYRKVSKAQLANPKLQQYIDSKVKNERERIIKEIEDREVTLDCNCGCWQSLKVGDEI